MEDGGGTTFLFREEWAERTGEESWDGAVAARASRRSRSCHTRPCNEIAMVAGVGPLGTGILADAGFDQFRLWQRERTAAPVGTGGKCPYLCRTVCQRTRWPLLPMCWRVSSTGRQWARQCRRKNATISQVKMMVRLSCLRSTRTLSANGGAKSIA